MIKINDPILIGGRSRNILKNMGIHTKSDAVKAIFEGRLSPEIENYGWESFCQLCCALSISPNYRSENYYGRYEIFKKFDSSDYQI